MCAVAYHAVCASIKSNSESKGACVRVQNNSQVATSGGSTGAAPRQVGPNVGNPVKVVLSAWPVHTVTKGLTKGSHNKGLPCERGT